MARRLERSVALAAWLMLNPWMTASAADVVVGSVLAVRGAVFSDTAAGQQPLVVNAAVHRGDTIVTVAGKAKIALNDGSIISIGENSRVAACRLRRQGLEQRRSRVTLLTGVLRAARRHRTTSPGTFEVETETAIAAVRGTDWVIEATPERTSVAVRARRRRRHQSRRPPTDGAASLARSRHRRAAGRASDAAVPWGIKRLADVLARATF